MTSPNSSSSKTCPSRSCRELLNIWHKHYGIDALKSLLIKLLYDDAINDEKFFIAECIENGYRGIEDFEPENIITELESIIQGWYPPNDLIDKQFMVNIHDQLVSFAKTFEKPACEPEKVHNDAPNANPPVPLAPSPSDQISKETMRQICHAMVHLFGREQAEIALCNYHVFLDDPVETEKFAREALLHGHKGYNLYTYEQLVEEFIPIIEGLLDVL